MSAAGSQGRKRRRRSTMVKFSASGDIISGNDIPPGGQLDDKDGNLESQGDSVFDPCAEMLIHDYDDERTLEEEEALETNEDPQVELSDLQKEGDMPLSELLAMYGYSDENAAESSQGGSNKQQQQQQQQQQGSSEGEQESGTQTQEKDPLQNDSVGVVDENSTGLSASTNTNDEVGQQDDEVADEPSALAQLYPELPQRPSHSTAMANMQGAGAEGSSRLLRSVSSRPQSEEEDDDGDYSPEEEDWKKTIMVGSDYQAKVPVGLCKYDDALPYENDDKILWNPHHISEREVVFFLTRINEPRSPDIVKDDEQALYLLLQCGYNVEEALRRRRINAVPPAETMSIWSEEECRNFETGMRLYGKDFYLIQKNKVHTRSVGELVQFYYLWKKTERHDVYAHKTRLEKKRHSLHPGITDFMDRFLDEQEVGTSPHIQPDQTKRATDLAVDPLSDGLENKENGSELLSTSDV